MKPALATALGLLVLVASGGAGTRRPSARELQGLPPEVQEALAKDPRGVVKLEAIREAQAILGPDLLRHAGKGVAELEDLVKAEVYKQQGISRFTPRSLKMRADALAHGKLQTVLAGLQALPREALPPGTPAPEAPPVLAEPPDAPEAAAEPPPYPERLRARTRAARPLEVAGYRISRFTGMPRDQIEAVIEADVYAEMAVTRFTPRTRKARADAYVRSKLADVLAALQSQ